MAGFFSQIIAILVASACIAGLVILWGWAAKKNAETRSPEMQAKLAENSFEVNVIAAPRALTFLEQQMEKFSAAVKASDEMLMLLEEMKTIQYILVILEKAALLHRGSGILPKSFKNVLQIRRYDFFLRMIIPVIRHAGNAGLVGNLRHADLGKRFRFEQLCQRGDHTLSGHKIHLVSLLFLHLSPSVFCYTS